MTTDMDSIEQLYRQYSRQVLATLLRLLGDFAMAEEAIQEAVAAALRQWPDEGIPDNPSAWLIRAGHRKGIDQIRRKQTAQHYAHPAGDVRADHRTGGRCAAAEAGLQLLDGLATTKEILNYHLYHAARAGHLDEALASYQRALSLATQAPEQRFLQRRLNELNRTS